MYNELTGRYTFPCPVQGEVRLPLSDFRVLERLAGTAHPAVYKVTFACACGDDHEDRVGVAVECPACARTSVNLVTRPHVDVPFYNDRRVDVIEHIFCADRHSTVDAFRAELDSSAFDARRRNLAA